MAAKKLEFDRHLCDPRNIFLELRVGDVQSKPSGAFNGELGRAKVHFQFPPKIESDSREATWKEKAMRSDEPMALFTSSSGRKITMRWTYIVEDSSDIDTSVPIIGNGAAQAPSPVWNTATIKEQIRRLRGYFNLVKAKPQEGPMVVRLKLWGIGGQAPTTGRLVSADVKYGETMVAPRVLGNIDYRKAFYQRTDITTQIRLWYKGTGEVKTQIADLQEFTPTAWF